MNCEVFKLLSQDRILEQHGRHRHVRKPEWTDLGPPELFRPIILLVGLCCDAEETFARGDEIMSDAKPHLKTLEEIERDCIPGLVEVLREEGVEGVC